MVLVCLPGAGDRDTCAFTALCPSAILGPSRILQTGELLPPGVSWCPVSLVLATMESWLGTHCILLVKSELFKHKRMQEVWQIEP